MESKEHKPQERRKATSKKQPAQALSNQEISSLVDAVDSKMQHLRAKLARLESELQALKSMLEAEEGNQDRPSQIV